MYIPMQYWKQGRTFTILGLDKDGKPRVYSDKDNNPFTITVDIDLDGYAFDLVYVDK